MPDYMGNCILGNFIYDRGLTYLQHMAAATAENLSQFIDFCIQNDLCVTFSTNRRRISWLSEKPECRMLRHGRQTNLHS